jgi:integrase
MPDCPYSDLKIYGKRLDHELFVGFKYFCAKRLKEKRPQVRLGINYQPTIKARTAEAEQVKDLVERCLKEGWNPFECNIQTYLKEKRAAILRAQEEENNKKKDDPRFYGFNDAMDWAFSKKELKKDTKPGYESVLRFIKQAAIDIGIDQKPILEVSRYYICELLDRMRDNRQREYDESTNPRFKGKKVTPNLYNYYLDKVSALLFEYENRGIIEHNPCHKIAKKDNEIDFGIHRHPTEQELNVIKSELPKVHPELYNFARFVHVTGMRPDEILDVKFSMVDYLNSTINISDAPYNEDGELISKTTNYRRVPVPGFFLEWIKQRGNGVDPQCYIFSSKLKPGTYRIGRKWISTLWKIVVIDKIGVDVSIYSFKGLGGDAKREAGIEISAVSGGYGHTGQSMARNIYLSKEGERLIKELIEKTPDL